MNKKNMNLSKTLNNNIGITAFAKSISFRENTL